MKQIKATYMKKQAIKSLGLAMSIITAIGVSGCESRDDIFKINNTVPAVTLSATSSMSGAVSAIDTTMRYSEAIVLYYAISDNFIGDGENPGVSVTVDDDGIEVETYIDKSRNMIMIKELSLPTRESPVSGKATVRVIAQDYYASQGEAVVNIDINANRAPVADFTVEQISGAAGMDYTISAANSSDPDGDGIVAYEYLIDGTVKYDETGYENDEEGQFCVNPGHAASGGTYIIATELSSANHVFQSAGSHTVAVRAKDGLGMWGRWTTRTITIN